MIYGYASLTSADPDLFCQRKALRAVGCGTIFEDRASGSVRARLGLGQALATCQKGDLLVIQRLELLGRSPPHLIEILDNLMKRGIGLRSLTEPIDTRTQSAHLAVVIVGALADFQRRHMAVRDRRRLGPVGPPKPVRPSRAPDCRFKLSPDDIAFAQQLIGSGEKHRAVAAHLGVARGTLYRSLARAQEQSMLKTAAPRR